MALLVGLDVEATGALDLDIDDINDVSDLIDNFERPDDLREKIKEGIIRDIEEKKFLKKKNEEEKKSKEDIEFIASKREEFIKHLEKMQKSWDEGFKIIKAAQIYQNPDKQQALYNSYNNSTSPNTGARK